MASIPDLLILKAYAFEKREKPKDAYDLCFCLEHYPGGRQALAREFRRRLEAEGPVAALANQALLYLQEKFATLNPQPPGSEPLR